jgi:hypothetical protein
MRDLGGGTRRTHTGEDAMKDGESVALDRRGFLTLGGLTAAAAVAASGEPASAQAQTGDEARKARYRETPHVQAFYRTARYRKNG